MLEDTARRDFTINALYYNINLDAIEDFTDTGLSDLELGQVRTPSDPFRSFKEVQPAVCVCICVCVCVCVSEKHWH